MSAKPAQIGSLGGYADGLVVGAPANVTLYDPEASRSFSAADLAGKGVNSPYLGLELPGRVVHTFHAGRRTVADGVVLDLAEVAGA
jgi:dihydroorotase